MSRDTRLVLVAPNGARITEPGKPSVILALDLSSIPNADARVPLTMAVEQRCNMGHWHTIGDRQLPLYDGVTP
jgi:hypothetical protein